MRNAAQVLREYPQIVLGFVTAAVLFGIAVAISPAFADGSNLRSLGIQASFVGIVAIGQTVVILTGGVDLSIPWVMGSVALFLAHFSRGEDGPLLHVIPLLLAYGAAIGLVNGIGVAGFGISPIVMTLATGIILQGATSLITGASQTGGVPPGLASFTDRDVGPIPVVLAIWLALAVVTCIGLSLTTFGRKVYAVGTNARVATFSGVSVAWVRCLTYVASGFTAAVGGILVVGYSGQAFAELGSPYLFASVAAVAIGGASILGGSGNYVGTIAGALVVTVLPAMLPILSLSEAWLSIVYGLVILLALSLATIRRPSTKVRMSSEKAH